MYPPHRSTIATSTVAAPQASLNDAAQPSTFVIEGASYGGVYISPNVAYLPSIPPRPRKRPCPWDALRRGWVTQQSFYHMLTPNINPFDDPLFYPLVPTLLSSAIEPVPVPGKPERTAWQLVPAIAERWFLLEQFLLACEGSLTQWGVLLYPIDFCRPRPPSTYRFMNVFDTRAAAHKATGLARAAFISLACLISLHIARLNARIPPGRTHSWNRGMPLDGFMSPDVVDLLRRSWVGMPWVPRVGAFIDMREPENESWLDILKDVLGTGNVVAPLWLRYDPRIPQLPPTSHLPLFRNAVQPRLQDDSGSHHPAGQTALQESDSEGLLESEAPQPNSNTRQKPGESIFEFLARELWETELYLATESFSQRVLREEREATARGCPFPDLASSLVYMWTPIRTYWVRQLVPSINHEKLWQDTLPHHRVYNSLRNEWDVAYILAPDYTAVEDLDAEWDSGFDDDTWTDTSTLASPEPEEIQPLRPVAATSTSTIHAQGQRPHLASPAPDGEQGSNVGRNTESLSQMGSVLLSKYTTTETGLRIHMDPALDVLRERYGLHLEVPYESRITSKQPIPEKAVLRALVDYTNASAGYSPDVLRALTDFVACLTQDIPLPPTLCDLSPDNRSSFVTRRDAPMTVKRVSTPEGGSTYVIQPLGSATANHAGWVLTVPSATTAAQILRCRWGPGTEDVALELMKRGIAFSTLRSSSNLSPGVKVPRARLQPQYREPRYQSTVLDFMLYEQGRQEFMSQPYARAALMRGGIVWRLAYEAIDPGRVLLDPSASAQGQVRFVGQPEFYDDDLNEADLDRICGVYHVWQDPSKISASDSSWWPKDSTWQISGLNAGYWTDQNEE